MKEYKLKINGEIDFIIISPQVLSSLISQIHNSPEREVAVNIEDIMPPGFTDYLLRVINVNRFTNERFRYYYILENPVTKKGLYEILKQQLSNADIEKSPCFQTIRLTDTFRGMWNWIWSATNRFSGPAKIQQLSLFTRSRTDGRKH